MPILSKITDGKGRGLEVEVTKHRALLIAETCPDVPPIGTQNCYRYYTEYLTYEEDKYTQAADGSATPMEFVAESSPDYDKHVMGIAILIADSAIAHNNFGNVAPLAVGWDLYVVESAETTYIIEKASTGGQIIAQAGFREPYGNTTTTWELQNWTGLQDAQTIYIPINDFVPGGIRIGRGTLDKVASLVNDDLRGLDLMWVKLFGYKHFPYGEIE